MIVLPKLKQLITSDMDVVVTGATSSGAALATRNGQHANVAATISANGEYVVVEEGVYMSQYHFSRYDYHTEEILHPPQNPESILCSCFVVAQREQGMAANLQHHDEVSVEIDSQEMSEEDEGIRQSWAPGMEQSVQR